MVRVYYLCSSKYAMDNLKHRRIKIARISELNDPFELLGADLVNPIQREAFRSTKEKRDGSTGVLCFSKTWCNPVLWAHYADRHRGVCLGFDVPDGLPTEVLYRKSPLRVPFQGDTPMPVLEKFFHRLIRTKYQDWKYEDEVRVFVKLDNETEQAGLYFCRFSEDLQLREVILGPRCALSATDIRSLVGGYGYPVEILKGRLAFRKFKVVQDRGFDKGARQA